MSEQQPPLTTPLAQLGHTPCAKPLRGSRQPTPCAGAATGADAAGGGSGGWLGPLLEAAKDLPPQDMVLGDPSTSGTSGSKANLFGSGEPTWLGLAGYQRADPEVPAAPTLPDADKKLQDESRASAGRASTVLNGGLGVAEDPKKSSRVLLGSGRSLSSTNNQLFAM